MKKYVLLVSVIVLLVFSNLSAQNNFNLQFKPIITNTDSITVETLKFYISSVQLNYEDGSRSIEPNSFHLLDIENSKSLIIKSLNAKNKPIKSISFNIGIDSITNISGAMGGDLDPTKGMYWTWQSGYVNFKLEGKSKYCNTKNNEFQFHLGGYQFPYNTLQNIALSINTKDKVEVLIDVDYFLKVINLREINHIMSPSKKGKFLSEKLSTIFRIK